MPRALREKKVDVAEEVGIEDVITLKPAANLGFEHVGREVAV